MLDFTRPLPDHAPDQTLQVPAATHRKSAECNDQARCRPFTVLDLCVVCGISMLAFLVLGYHPYAEDGGIYAAALAAKLDPTLFVHDRAWVTGHTRFSLFVPIVAGVLRLLHLSLPAGLLLLQMGSTVATVWALLQMARLCFASAAVARWATLLVAVAAGLPIAGTSLYLIDPYATARSLTTPLLLLAATACLRRRWVQGGLLWLTACALHPLMALWGALPLVLLPLLRRDRPGDVYGKFGKRRIFIFTGAVVAICGLAWKFSPLSDDLGLQIAQTRGYWFLSQWRWFEMAGAVLPLALLACAERWPQLRRSWTEAGQQIALAVSLSTSTGVAIALLFAHAAGRSMAIARLQPLRTFHLFYAVFLLLLAGTVADRAKTTARAAILTGLTAAIAALLALSQHGLYPASQVFELPGRRSLNGWVQAFAWAREHTPPDALFALDTVYTTLPDEEAQGFRAIALRSVLPDRAKDGGIAAVVPALSTAWQVGNNAQAGLNSSTDADRRTRLLPLGVSWIVLPAGAPTALPCGYRNAVAEVCRLR